MSTSKSPPPLALPSTSDAPPPSYSESLSAPRPPDPLVPRVSTLIESHILPHLHNDPSTTLVLIPSNVLTLIPPCESSSSKSAPPPSFPAEVLVGFPSTETPTIIRLSEAENALEFWRRTAVIGELEDQLRTRLGAEGYSIVDGSPKAKVLTSSRVPGSRDVDWKGVERKQLGEGEARVSAEVNEVCLRIENEMGLYETRTGRAIVVRVEVGTGDDVDDWGG